MNTIFCLFHSFLETPLYNSSQASADKFLFSFTPLSTEVSELSPHFTVNLIACIYLISPFSTLSVFSPYSSLLYNVQCVVKLV